MFNFLCHHNLYVTILSSKNIAGNPTKIIGVICHFNKNNNNNNHTNVQTPIWPTNYRESLDGLLNKWKYHKYLEYYFT